MSCPRSLELDALAFGELSPEVAAGLLAHASGCATCARELAWLSAERRLFAQRARGHEPGFDRVRARVQPQAPQTAPSHGWRRTLASLAAGLVLLVATDAMWGRHEGGEKESRAELASAWVGGFSVDPGELIASLEHRYGACLVATPSLGTPCRERSPADELAMSMP